jgi:NaMN:DMB phosphoribosyltransferase
MGIANTTTAAALASRCWLPGGAAGAGTGVDVAGVARKRRH